MDLRSEAFEDGDGIVSSRKGRPQQSEQDVKAANSSGKKKLVDTDLEGSKMQSELQGFLTERDNEEDQTMD